MGAQLLPLSTLPHLRLYRRGTGVALIAAPLFFLADNLLHPKEFERGNESEQLAAIADNYTRWQAAHALGFVAILLFAAATLGLAFLVRRRQPRLGLAGGALAVAGLLGLAAVLTIDGYSWAIVAEASRRPEVGTETTIVSNAYFIAGALVFLVAATGCALAILRMSDDEFAQGTAYSRTSSSTDRPPIST